MIQLRQSMESAMVNPLTTFSIYINALCACGEMHMSLFFFSYIRILSIAKQRNNNLILPFSLIFLITGITYIHTTHSRALTK